jgi:tyrosinase
MAQPYTRFNAWTIAAGHPFIDAYANAVAAMQAKGAADPVSWTYQAAIHGTKASQVLPQWNKCEHGSWFFVSWHRMYLYFFEKIARAQVIANGGPSDWALPYWNYDGGGTQNQIPLDFRSPKKLSGADNPLYVAQRNSSVNNGGGLPSLVTSPSVALGKPLFTGKTQFGGGIPSMHLPFVDQKGQLEHTPHDDVHSTIGGLMGDIDTAAVDPIFWLHHANIDRIWWFWQKNHKNPTDSAWLNAKFEFFDENGALVTLTGADVQDITAQLGYQYDQGIRLPVLPPIVVLPLVRWPGPWPDFNRRLDTLEPSVGERRLVGAVKDVVRLVGERTTIPVSLDDRTMRELADRSDFRSQGRMFLEIENVTSKRNPNFVYGIFINLPMSVDSEELKSHHVGNLSLFGIERANAPRSDRHAHAFGLSIEITDVLDKLAIAGEWLNGRLIDVTFLPISIESPADSRDPVSFSTNHHDFPVEIGRIALSFV